MAIDVLDVIGLRLFKQQIEFEEDDRDELITLYAQPLLITAYAGAMNLHGRLLLIFLQPLRALFSLSLLTCLNTGPRKAKCSFTKTLQLNA